MANTLLKTCSRCGVDGSADAFDRDRSRPDGLSHWCSPCRRDSNRLGTAKLKAAVVKWYGGQCACCTESSIAFLGIDHMEGGGTSHRRAMRFTGSAFYRWLVREGFPDGFRVLCHNCNMAIGQQGICPHQLED